MDQPARRRTALTWIVTALGLVVVLLLLGTTLRLAQAGLVAVNPVLFYAIMTLHGLGMAGVLYSAGLAVLWYLVARHAHPSIRLMHVSWVLVVLGALGLVAATLVARFGTGWYLLYPLPFTNPVWPTWGTGLAVVSLMLLGVAWLLVQLDLLRALAARYGVGGMFGWGFFRAGEPPGVPPVAIIAAVTALAASLATVCGAAMLMLYLLQWLNPGVAFDPLLMKNMVFFFGHTIVNVAMYCGVAVVYELLPGFTGRPWRANRIVALAWNATFVFVLLAYCHHLYMDFAQPTPLQYVGQIASYLSAIPATVVTAFGVIAQVYRSGLRWGTVPLALVAGVVGWVAGGFGAVVDGTIALNRVLHNTLWVPGHFHTYFLLGFLLMLLAFAHQLVGVRGDRIGWTTLWVMLLAGYGFVGAFYLGGIHAVPRRFASYQMIQAGDVAGIGRDLALYGGAFATLFVLALLGHLGALWAGRPRRVP